MATSVIEGEQRSVSTRFDISIVALTIAGISTFLNVYTTQALLPYLRHVFHASELEVSLTISATTLATAIFAPFVGIAAESIGRKKVIVPAIFGLSVPTFLLATSPNLHWLIFWRFCQGIFIAGIIATVMAYINEEWAGRGVGTAITAYVSGTVFGGFIGRLIPGVIATHWQWRYAFVVLAVMNLMGGLAVRRWLPKAQRFVAAGSFGHSLHNAFAHVRSPQLLAVFGQGMAALFALVGGFTYINFYLAAPPFQLNSAQLGSIFFVYLLGLIVTPASGSVLDRTGYLPTCMMALAMSSVGLLLTLIHAMPAIILGLALFSSGVFVMQAAATAQTGHVAGKARSTAAGMYLTFYYTGGTLGATVPAFAWALWGWPGCAGLILGVLMLAFCLALISSRGSRWAA
jgi:predicted MFS family arabinose efflux permease